MTFDEIDLSAKFRLAVAEMILMLNFSIPDRHVRKKLRRRGSSLSFFFFLKKGILKLSGSLVHYAS